MAAVVCVLWVTHNRPSLNSAVLKTSKPNAMALSSLPTPESAVTVEGLPPQVPRLDFPPSSIEAECGLNEYVPYHYDDPENQFHWPKSPYDASGKVVALESAACWAALENYIHTINPYLWGRTHENSDFSNHPLAFFVLEDPLTFERIFTDPASDFARVQDTLSRPECLLKQDETDWELKESCHTDALLNYALINHFCFDEGVSNRERAYYSESENPTPEQDRLMWKQFLEGAWVRKKCEELDQTLKFTSEHHPSLYKLLLSLREADSRKGPQNLLIELAARLGDDTAGLTRGIAGFKIDGYKFGRFEGVLGSFDWLVLTSKEEPNADRFLRAFHILTLADSRRFDPRDEIEFDWTFVARYLCEPPYYEQTLFNGLMPVENVEHANCKEIVHELRQRDLKLQPVLDVLDKFEQAALELGVYE